MCQKPQSARRRAENQALGRDRIAWSHTERLWGSERRELRGRCRGFGEIEEIRSLSGRSVCTGLYYITVDAAPPGKQAEKRPAYPRFRFPWFQLSPVNCSLKILN